MAMKDNWATHNTDKMLLFIALILAGYLVMHIIHHDAGDMQAMTWAEGAFSTILGALILILTGRVQRADNGNSTPPIIVNNHPISPNSPPIPVTPASATQTWVKK